MMIYLLGHIKGLSRYFLVLKRKGKINFIGRGEVSAAFSLRRVDVPSPEVVLTFSGPNRSESEKENHIVPVVSEILRYRHTIILLLLFKNCDFFQAN